MRSQGTSPGASLSKKFDSQWIRAFAGMTSLRRDDNSALSRERQEGGKGHSCRKLKKVVKMVAFQREIIPHSLQFSTTVRFMP